METLVERGCGLDVHQATVVACLLIVRKDGKVQKQVRTFGTTTRELLSMREWVALPRLHPCGHGKHGRLLEAGLRSPRGSISDRGGQCTTRQEGSWA